MNPGDQSIEAPGCQWDKRPKGAPSFHDVAGSMRELRRQGDALVVEYDLVAAPAIRELMEAERLCCPHVRWDLKVQPVLELTMVANESWLNLMQESLAMEQGDAGRHDGG